MVGPLHFLSVTVIKAIATSSKRLRSAESFAGRGRLNALQLRIRYAADSLHVECSRIETVREVRNFEAGISNVRCAWNVSYHRAFMVQIIDAENQAGTRFLHQTQIYEPNLAAFCF